MSAAMSTTGEVGGHILIFKKEISQLNFTQPWKLP